MLNRFVASIALTAAVTAVPGCKKQEADVPAATDAATPAAPAAEPRKIDMSDNKDIEEIARKAVEAYSKRNAEALAEIGPPGAKDKTIFIEPRNPNYQALFGDDTWNMKTTIGWDGRIIGIERGIDAAYAIYAEDAEHRYAVELHKLDVGWRFYHLKKLSKQGGGGFVVNPGGGAKAPEGGETAPAGGENK